MTEIIACMLGILFGWSAGFFTVFVIIKYKEVKNDDIQEIANAARGAKLNTQRMFFHASETCLFPDRVNRRDKQDKILKIKQDIIADLNTIDKIVDNILPQ